MAFLNLFANIAPIEINRGMETFKKAPGAVLLDVRTREEYSEAYIGGSINVPLDELNGIAAIVRNPDTPIFVYCRSERRSARAASFLRRIGYTNVRDIGGILDYKGEIKALKRSWN